MSGFDEVAIEDLFAMVAMHGLMGRLDLDPNEIATIAWRVSDAMMEMGGHNLLDRDVPLGSWDDLIRREVLGQQERPERWSDAARGVDAMGQPNARPPLDPPDRDPKYPEPEPWIARPYNALYEYAKHVTEMAAAAHAAIAFTVARDADAVAKADAALDALIERGMVMPPEPEP